MDVLHDLGIRGPLVALQILGFLLTFAVLKLLLFDRVRRQLAARAADEARGQKEIAAGRQGAAAAEAVLRERQAEIEKEAYERTQTEVRTGLKKKADLVAEAHDQAHAALLASQETLAAERQSALGGLGREVADLALLAASQAMLGRKLEEHRWRAVAERATRASAEEATG